MSSSSISSEDSKEVARPQNRNSGFATVLSGAVSGAIVSSIVQPLDVLRTKQQADAARGVFGSSMSCLRDIVSRHGIKGLWSGTQATVLRLSVGAGLHFYLLERIKSALSGLRDGAQPKGWMAASDAALAGGVSRAVAASLLCPVTVVKTRMEYGWAHEQMRYRNVFDALTTIAREEKLRGLFRGLGPTVISNAPFSALYYMFYSQIQQRLSQRMDTGWLVNFTSGTLAAAAATVLTQPADVVRTHMQLNLATASSSSLSTASKIMNRGGRTFMTGFGPRVVKRTLQTALVWTLYEELLPLMTQAGSWAQEKLHSPSHAAPVAVPEHSPHSPQQRTKTTS